MRPNILLIHADQHRADCLGAAGHPFLQTPNLDRLASEGVRFENAFTPCPVCTPARNSLMYGCWPTQHGAIANHNTEAPPRQTTDSLPTWSEALCDSGYWLGYIGKWGVHADKSPFDYGFQRYVPESDYAIWRAGVGLPPTPTLTKASDYFGSTDTAASEAQTRPAWGANETIRMLEAAVQRPSDTPFLIRWDPSEPHPPAYPPEPFASLYLDRAEPPPNYTDTLENKPAAQRMVRRLWGLEGWDREQWRPIIARTLGILTLLDRQIGRVLEALERLGLAETTLVIYTADHGDMLGAHGMFDKHYSLYDDIVRVPFIVRWPGRIAHPGSVSSEFLSHEIDLAATLCAAAEIAAPEGFVGRDLLPLLTGQEWDSPRDTAFSQYFGTNLGLYSSRMIRNAHWKYVWHPTDRDELYDFLDTNEPGETVNRIDDPACAEIQRQLKQRLAAWMREIHDPLLNKWTRSIFSEFV